MADEEKKQQIEEELKKKSKNKTKFYFSDLAKITGDKPRVAKKYINEMVSEQRLCLWSSGSTSMYYLPGMGISDEEESEE